MATLPTDASLTGSTTTNAQQKTNFSALRSYLADLLGTDSSNKAAARAALGVPGLLDFSSSMGNPGWQKLPSGLIIQWFRNTVVQANGSGAATFNLVFPTAFTSTVLGSAFYPISEAASIAAGQTLIGSLAPTKTGMSINLSGAPASAFVAISGLVIGI